MKKLILILMTVAYPAYSQIKWPSNLVTEQRMKQYVDSVIKANAVVSPPVIVKPPVVVLPKCDQGPEINGIGKITSTTATVTWHGENIPNLEYQIWNENLTGTPIYIDSIKPQSAVLEIKYKALPNGTYNLRLIGKTCSGSDTRKFTVKTDGSAVIPTPPPAQPNLGLVVPKKIATPLPENMDIQVFKVKDQWLFSDMSNKAPPFGYEYWYGINGQIIKQGIPLRNYPWPANTPVQIWKAQARIGLSTLAKWRPDAQADGWIDPLAGKVFSYNDAYPFTSFLFEPANKGYDTTRHVAHWMDVMPDMKLPLGNVWIMPIGPIDTPDFLLSKGVTHFSKFQAANKPYWNKLLNEGKLYDEVPQTPTQFDLPDYGPAASRWVPVGVDWPYNWNERFFGPYSSRQTEPGSYELGFAAGSKYPINYPIVVFENTEQDHALSDHWPINRGFYDAYMPRMNDYWLPKGITPLVAHNYFTTFKNGRFTLGYDSRENNKAILRTPYKDWPSEAGQLGINGTLSKTTAVCFGLYLEAPDQVNEVAYRLIFSAEVAKVAGKNLIVFGQMFDEWLPNNLQKQSFPEGDFYMPVKKSWNPANGITYSFLAQTFGKGFIPFSAAGKTPEKFAYDREWKGAGSLWVPKSVSNTRENNEYRLNADTFPYWTKPGEQESYQSGQAEYFVAEGVRLFTETWVPTWQGERKFLKFRIDGGNWTIPTNQYMDDLVDAFFDKRGFVYSQRRGNQLSVFYLNSFADNNLHTLEYEYENKVYSMQIHSTIIHPKLISL